MKLPFVAGPLDGQNVEIGNNLLELIDVYEPFDGPAVPFEPVSPNNGLWTYSLATLSDDSVIYVGKKQPSAPGTQLDPETWTRIGPFDIYNPTTEAQTVVSSQTAVVLPDGYRVRLV